MTSKALLSAESNAVSRLVGIASKIEELVLNQHHNRDEGEEPTWGGVRKYATAEYLLHRVYSYLDSGEAEDEIDIIWTWKEGEQNHEC